MMNAVIPSELEESGCETDNLAPRHPSAALRFARDDN
jgi:hypothetical protein